MLGSNSNIDQEKWELNLLLEELNGENERAAALVGAAWMDEIILQLLRAFMVSHKETDKLLGLDNYGQLGTYSLRVRLAFSLGLTAEEEMKNLLAIGKIRNLFAHRIHRSTFENPKIQDLCRKLSIGKKFLKDPENATPREIFSSTVAGMAYSFGNRIQRVKTDQRALKN